MKTIKFISKLVLIFVLTATVTSCGLASTKATPTPLPTATFTVSPTSTDIPTATLTLTPTKWIYPTSTIDATSTAQYNNMSDFVSDLYDQGYVPSLKGTYHHLDDYSNQWAQLDWYQWNNTGWAPKDFVFKAHMAWTSDTKTPNPSGCGVVFHVQPTYEHYVVFVLSIGYVEFAITTDSVHSQPWDYFGSPQNNGAVNFSMTSIGSKIDVFINGKHINTYTAYQGKMTGGDLGFTVLSGTNAGFGTGCDITDADLWMVK